MAAVDFKQVGTGARKGWESRGMLQNICLEHSTGDGIMIEDGGRPQKAQSFTTLSNT